MAYFSSTIDQEFRPRLIRGLFPIHDKPQIKLSNDKSKLGVGVIYIFFITNLRENFGAHSLRDKPLVPDGPVQYQQEKRRRN